METGRRRTLQDLLHLIVIELRRRLTAQPQVPVSASLAMWLMPG